MCYFFSRIFIFCSDLDPDLPIDIVHLRDHLVASVIFLTQFKMASSSSSCSGNLVETSLASFSSFACSDDSSCGHGACNEDSECVCNPPWTGEFFEFRKRAYFFQKRIRRNWGIYLGKKLRGYRRKSCSHSHTEGQVRKCHLHLSCLSFKISF